jgi:outer membrane receptor protein involved in Fe transport
MDLQRLFPKLWVVLVVSLVFATAARADSAIIGTVLSAETKQPLPDVVVSVHSPALQGQQQVAITDAEGRFRVAELPPGLYSLLFEKETFKPFTRSELQLRQDRTLRVNVELLVADFTEEFMLGPCGAPIVDVSSTTTGVSVEHEFIQRIAVNPPRELGGAVRSFDSLAALALGARRDAPGVSINGATAFENRFEVDGLSTNDPGFGLNARPLSVEFIQDVNVVTGGYMAEYGRATGGIIETQTLSGSNEFHGSVFAHWVPGLLEGARTSGLEEGSGSLAQTALVNLGDFGATLGGPLVKDKLWFFTGVAPALSRLEHTRGLADDATGRFADQRTLQALGKLTYLFNPDHNVSLAVSTAPTDVRDPWAEATGSRSRDSNFTTGVFQHRGAFLDKKVLVDSNLGWSHLAGAGRADRYQANVKAITYLARLAGEHLLKAGVDAELLSLERASRSTSLVLGGFVQDSWTLLHRYTLSAGLRYDVQSLDVGDGRRVRVPGSPLSPRLGLVVDPWADGLTKLFAHYAQYRMPLPLAWVEGASSASELAAPASREVVVGAEREVFSWIRLIATYTHRDLDPALAGTTGGLRPARTYDAATVAMSRIFGGKWLARLGYTWSRLSGDALGPLRAGERPHAIQAFGAREFSLTKKLSASLGLSYRGGSGASTPWVHVIDSNAGVRYRLDRDNAVSFSLDAFNLLNAQEATRVEELAPDTVVPLEYQAPRQVRLGARYSF